MRFFSQFPKVNYDINDQAVNTSLIDIYRHVGINEELLDDITNYTYYTIKDGERPDVVSYKLYDTPEYHWTFFIINSQMKNGLNDWPRTYNEQVSYIEKKYDEYSILEFIPSQIETNGKIKYNNYFGNIDFNDDNIILRRSDNPELNARIEAYDSERLQIWIKDAPSTFLSNEETSYYMDYETDSDQELNTWLENYALPFVKDNHPELYEDLIEDERLVLSYPYYQGYTENTDPDLIELKNTYIQSNIDTTEDPVTLKNNIYKRGDVYEYANYTVNSLLHKEYLKQIAFVTDRSWVKSYNAPYAYYDTNEEEMNAYDALKLDPNNDNYITYVKAEDDLNESKTKIRVLRPSEVEGFAEYYNELLNE